MWLAIATRSHLIELKKPRVQLVEFLYPLLKELRHFNEIPFRNELIVDIPEVFNLIREYL